MKGFVLVVFIVNSIVLGYELYTGEAFTRTGTGTLEDEPLGYTLMVIFHALISLICFILLLLPKQYLTALNEWLKLLDRKYD